MNEQSLFLEALERADTAERSAFLDRSCADPDLRKRVESLLAAHERSGEFLDAPALGPIARDAADETRAEPSGSGGLDLPFLQPPTKPGSIGRLGHYEIASVLGRGGCGIVLKAFDEKLERTVAVKAMAPELAATSPARKRFLREARAAAAVRHENVIGIHAVEDSPIPFLVMEYVPGPTLQEMIDGAGPLEVARIAEIGRQIALGLDAAHSLGLIHRDIKPANIILEREKDRVKITDFGLARTADDASVTQSGTIAGTPLYMSPEQARGGAIDARSDLFSLGSVLYVMTAGRPPFRAAGALAVLRRVAEDEPRPIREIIPETPEWLVDLIAKLHAKDPAARFGSAREVSEILERRLAERRPPQRPAPADDRAARPSSRAVAGRSEIPVSRPHARSGERRRLVLAGTAVALLLLAAWALAAANGLAGIRGVIATLWDPARLQVAASAPVAEAPDERPASVSPPPEPPAVGADADRRAAEHILAIPRDFGVMVQVNDIDQWYARPADLPRTPFRLTAVFVEWASKLDDEGLAPFEGCENVKILKLWGTQVTEKGLRRFAGCRGLVELSLNSAGVTDAALALFRDQKDLVALHLQGKFTDAGLANFKDCAKLERLAFRHAAVTDQGVANFHHLEGLRHLDLGETRLTNAGLAGFKSLKSLESVQLFGTRIDDAGLAALELSPNLTSLNLFGCGRVTDAGIEKLRRCSKLTSVALDRTAVGDGAVEFLQRNANLVEAGFAGTGVTDAGAANFARFKLLGALSLAGTRTTPAGLKALKECPNLERLTLDDLAIGDECVAVLRDFWKLRLLTLRRTRISESGAKSLADALPQCRIEWNGGVREPK